MSKPLCIDLFAGLGGFTRGFLDEGYSCIGFDIERHEYATPHGTSRTKIERYPAQLVLQDVLTLHGRQFRQADCLVASPPCTEYSYMAMPWSRAKQIAAALRGEGEFPVAYRGSRTIPELTALFDACFRIQREACEAAGRHIPMVVENVKGAQPWVGPAKANFGSFFLWGDVGSANGAVVAGRLQLGGYVKAGGRGAKGGNGSWFNIAHGERIEGNCAGHPTRGENEPRRKVSGMNFHEHEKTGKPGRSFQSAAVHFATRAERDGVKQVGLSGPAWFDHGAASVSSKSSARKAASAQIAKIPEPLARYIARAFKP